MNEKDFPSLKGMNIRSNSGWLYMEKDIQENCLDKKRVEEAKERFRDNCFALNLSKEDIILFNMYFEEFEKELLE